MRGDVGAAEVLLGIRRRLAANLGRKTLDRDTFRA
jgi:hypothetical protein